MQGEKSKEFIKKVSQKVEESVPSLENKSSRPHSVHPRAHTPEEVNLILRLVRRNPEEVNLILRLVRRDPGIGLNESYAKLLDKVYPRNFLSLYHSNRIPSHVLPSSDEKKHWLPPIQKRQDLLPTTNPKKFSDFSNFFVTRG